MNDVKTARRRWPVTIVVVRSDREVPDAVATVFTDYERS